MAKSSLKTETAWERYFSHQLSAEEKAESRERMLADLQKAKEEGVFEEMKRWRGKISGRFRSKSCGTLRTPT